MTGPDTSVIVRYIMQDDPRQSATAARLAERLTLDEPGYISLVTIVKIGWVVGSCYRLSHAQIGDALDALLRTKELIVERADFVMRAARAHRQGEAGLADCLIALVSIDAGCAHTITFERNAARHARGSSCWRDTQRTTIAVAFLPQSSSSGNMRMPSAARNTLLTTTSNAICSSMFHRRFTKHSHHHIW